ncbi:MAG: hypothetical protein JO222_08850, partial [Frankiales bacterium]|nr:hypothetical protein [Frankiales bacterium]
MQERRETAGFTMRLIVEYVRTHHGEAAVERMLELAGETRPLAMLENEAVWSSYDEKIALFAGAAAVTGRDDIARLVGETVLESSVGSTVKVALGLMGSPSSLLRLIPRANAKFSTAGEMHAEQVSRSSAVIRYRIKEGFVLSHFDCDYALGLLTQAPALFGLPAAHIVHDRCQVRGAPECIYEMRWRRRRRVFGRGKPALPADALLTRLHQLQDTLADLVASTEVDEVLDAIASRAGSAVSAERFVLAARLDPSEPVRVRYDGFDADRAQRVADALVAGQPVDSGAESYASVVEVRTAARSYGHLAAFARYPFLEHERELLEAYARLAATALSAVTAIAAAEDRRRAAEALLGLASTLHRAHSRHEVAGAIARASQSVVDADAAGVLLFDADDDTLRVAGHHG